MHQYGYFWVVFGCHLIDWWSVTDSSKSTRGSLDCLRAHLLVGWDVADLAGELRWTAKYLKVVGEKKSFQLVCVFVYYISNPCWIKMIIWAFEVVSAGIWTYGIKCIISNRGEIPLDLWNLLSWTRTATLFSIVVNFVYGMVWFGIGSLRQGRD